MLYEDAQHIHTAAVAEDVCCLTFSGLSKAYRMPGYRAGWVAVTGPLAATAAYREGLELLASLRLCPNVPAQHAIQTALGGYQSINDLILPGGRLLEQRNKAYDMLNAIPGVSTQQARGALYLFPKLDPEVYHIRDDEKFVLDLLREQKILVSHGRAFNWVRPDHFRMVTLPNVKDIEEAVGRMGDFLSRYQGN